MDNRVLVIEDEANIADYLIRGLREEGFVVEHAGDGAAAWPLLERGHWDLVLLDWWLPGQDGRELLLRFRRVDRRTPVLFLTARDRIPDRILGLDSGADDYLCKPFDFEELLARMRALIRRRDNADSALSHGDISVDLATRRATRAGKALDLTPKELVLLTHFLRHPGRLLTQSWLYDRVWDEPFDSSSNSLRVHVKELRRKLESHGPRVIHTLRGQGFRFGESPDPSPEGRR